MKTRENVFYRKSNFLHNNMKKSLLLGALALTLLALSPETVSAQSTPTTDYSSYVDPRIGTGGHGHTFLGASVPFGFIQLGPTEHTRGWDWCSGYHDRDNVIIGFGHMHLSGTGIGDLGDVAFLPMDNTVQDTVIFRHSDETVRPGYYAIQMHEPEIKVELTATTHAGMHRYTFDQGTKKGYVRIDLQQGIGWDHATAVDLRQENDTTISGLRFSKGWAADQRVYFVAEFSQPVKRVKGGKRGIAVYEVSDPSKPLVIRVGLSATSTEGARKNLRAEIRDWNFDEVALQAKEAWNEALGAIQFDVSNAITRTIFYTALYHAFIAPSIFSDVDGTYRGADGQVHEGTGNTYTTFSLWDTYRAEMPLLSIIEPDRAREIALTMLNIYDEQGRLPVWHLMGNETDCMVGQPGAIVLANYVLKGLIPDSLKEHAYEALHGTMMDDYRGLDHYRQYGYLPFDKDSTFETVAKTLEYAIAFEGTARVAKMLGKTADYDFFHKMGEGYRNLFDSRVNFMRGRDSEGNWREPFNPFHSIHREDDYTEGNAWQYTWLVPHNVRGLVSCFGSEKAFATKLDSLFVVQGNLGSEASPDISGLIGQYAHGNEPSHHIIYMYNYIGQQYKAARLVRETLNSMYRASIDGLSGNEDVGQMSAWYILSAMGLYECDPVSGRFVFGSPLMNKAVINVGNGKTFTIIARNNGAKNMYIRSARLNGKAYNKSYIDYKDIMRGGTLVFNMGPRPSSFGKSIKARP